MNIIKGLLIKDLLLLKSYKKNFLISLLIYGMIIITNIKNSDMVSFGASMIMFLFVTYANATFYYDEKTKNDRYVLTFPLTKNEVILSKYILGILSMLFGAVIGIIFSIVLSYFFSKELSNFNNLIPSILGTMLALSFVQSFQIPCFYKYGAEKGRTQIYLMLMVIFFIIGSCYMILPKIDLSFLTIYKNFISITLILLIIINYYISYKISCKIYSKKEV